MDLVELIPVALFIGTIGILLYMRYRNYASFPKEERQQIFVQKAKDAAGSDLVSFSALINELMPAIVTAVVLTASIYVILSPDFSDDKNKWAYGTIGMILGYWLRPTSKTSGAQRKEK